MIYELHVKDRKNDQESLDVALIWLSTWLRTRGRIDSYKLCEILTKPSGLPGTGNGR